MPNKSMLLSIILEAKDHASAALNKLNTECKALNDVTAKTAPMREFAGTLAKIGVAATGAGLALGLPLAGAVAGYEKLQDHVDRVAASMGGLKDAQRKTLETFVKNQAVATGYDMDAVTESVYQGVSAFLTFDQSMAVTSVSARLARATQGDLAETTDTLATAMLNFSDKTKPAAENAQIIADKFAAVQTKAKFRDMSQLNYAMSMAAPIAKSYGISLNETLGGMAAFSAAGDEGERAGTAFLEVVTQMGKGPSQVEPESQAERAGRR
jgi:TP901 family phage tail tape measure protein